jgi:tetratricopeptide (TPR) repeat protein
LARVAAARGNYSQALESYRALMAEAPTPEIAVTIGDLLARLGNRVDAEAMYAEAESLERDGWKMEEPQPAVLARMLAERGRKIDDAVTLAEQAARARHDIFTMDALAWAYFQAGRIAEARAASLEAMRTGSMDRRIRCHAKAIEHAAKFNAQNVATQCAFETWMHGRERE